MKHHNGEIRRLPEWEREAREERPGGAATRTQSWAHRYVVEEARPTSGCIHPCEDEARADEQPEYGGRAEAAPREEPARWSKESNEQWEAHRANVAQVGAGAVRDAWQDTQRGEAEAASPAWDLDRVGELRGAVQRVDEGRREVEEVERRIAGLGELTHRLTDALLKSKERLRDASECGHPSLYPSGSSRSRRRHGRSQVKGEQARVHI